MASTTPSSTDTPPRVTRRQFHSTDSGSIRYTIIEALAAAEGVSITELELCLADAVDSDAIDALLTHSATRATTVSVSFTLEEYTVVVEGSGQVTVTETR